MNELPPPAAPRPDCPDCRGRGLRFVRGLPPKAAR